MSSEEKVCIIKNVTSAVHIQGECAVRGGVPSTVEREDCAE